MAERLKIGFFDSGVGGINVMTAAGRVLPFADFLFYADTDHVPYGLKTPAQILTYAEEAVDFLTREGVDAVVVACNTATSIAIEHLRGKYSLPIVGMEPALKPAVKIHPDERILLCATPVTIRGDKLHDLIIHSGADPDLVPMPELVTYAEALTFDVPTVSSYLREKLDMTRRYGAVVLGCTHFSYFKDSFRAVLGNVDIIDGTEGTVKRLCSVLGEKIDRADQTHDGQVRYVKSGRDVTEDELTALRQIEERAKMILTEGTYK